MNRAQRRALGEGNWQPFEKGVAILKTEGEIQEMIAHWRRVKPDITENEVRACIRDIAANDEIWKNNRYQVNIRRMAPNEGSKAPPAVQLSIRRLDRKPIHDWRDLQRIKNELIGDEYEGVELYPAESRLVDTANQYFIHVIMDPAFRFPWGFQERCVNGESAAGAVQRPFGP